MADLDIIKKLEKEIGKKLRPLESGDIMDLESRGCYELDVHKNIIGLNLDDYQLTKLPESITQLINIQTLTLFDNKLTKLPESIAQLTNLQTLNLRNNQLTQLPESIAQLTNLQTLNLRNNQLTQLPESIGQLINLQILYFYDNQLTQLPESIAQLINLQVLDLDGNQLTQLPESIAQLINLQTLDLSSNQLTQLPERIGQLINLQKLDLNDNQLTQLPESIAQLINLQTLDLSSNQLTQFPESIAQLINLQTLDLSSNQLTQFPESIAQLINLQILDLVDNPLKSPPIDIATKGIKEIRSWFESQKGETRPLNEVKVLLIGDGGSGKTSLVKALLGKEHDSDEGQTHKINIDHWDISTGGKKIKVNLWDFGGQEIMHATHQFFLSKRSLYILVLDAREESDAEYWLKHIETFGGDSPILVIINKIDENAGYDVNRRFLQDKYKGIKGFHRLSCSKRTGTAEFSEALKKELAKVEMIEQNWGKSWFNVKTELEKLSDDKDKNFISYNDYKKICTDEGIDDKDGQDTLVGYLSDLGVVTHFKEMDLQGTYVLEPKWATGAVYKIINSPILADNKGILKLDSLAEILAKKEEDDYFYPQEQHAYIINLMEKFELCYKLDSKTILIPDLLEVQEPEFKFAYKDALKFIIEYDFLPRSIMPRFIVRLHKDIKNEYRWRTGLVLENKDFHSTAVIKEDKKAKKIFIWVNGDLKRDYFSVIKHTFEDINDSFEKLEVDEMVPCNCSECSKAEHPHFYKYKTLIKFKLNNVKIIVCSISVEEVVISDLLFGIEEKYASKEDEILSILKKLADKSDTKETLIEKINRIIKFKPSLLGIEIDVNEIVNLFLKNRKKPRYHN